TVNHDVVGSSPTGGVCKRSKERFFIYLSEVILILFLFSSLLIFNIFYKFVIFDSFILSNFVVYLIDFTLI
uniref:hypothetical protein n=1 Tax=Streptococcus pseudopneumoniae TaxID=257758 RepID=UPI000ABA0372